MADFVNLVVLLKNEEVSIGPCVNKLHYRLTAYFLIASSVVVAAHYVGAAPVACLTKLANPEAVQNYCWIGGSFVRNVTRPRDDAYPGVGQIRPEESVKFQRFYLWVPMVLFFQGVLFMAPYQLWKSWEDGLVKALVDDLRLPILESDKRLLRLEWIVKYLKQARGTHFAFGLQYVACELLYFVNIIFQIFLTDYFLDGEFSNYGIEIFQGYKNKEYPLARVFPKVAKCTMLTYGPSGTIQTTDNICALYLNIYYDKLYLLIWIWFMLLAAVTTVNTVYRVALIFEPRLRSRMIVQSGGRSLDRDLVDTVLGQQDLNSFQMFGEWALLQLIVRNLDAVTVNDLFLMIGKAVDDNRMNNNLES